MGTSKSKKAVSKSDSIQKEQAKETVKTAAAFTLESATKKLNDMQLAIGKQLSEVTNNLQNGINELKTVSDAVEVKKSELEELFGAEQLLKDTDELQVNFDNKKQELDIAFSQYETEINAKKTTLKLEQQKEQQQYDHERAQEKLLDEAEFNKQKIDRQSLLDAHEAEAKKGWAAREDELAKKEADYKKAIEDAALFPEKLKAEVNKEVAIATNSIKREYEHKLQLAQKDAETQKTVADSTITSLNKQLDASDKLIVDLQAQLSKSQDKVSEIAKSALEAASATKSLADVQSLIQTQSNGSNQKRSS